MQKLLLIVGLVSAMQTPSPAQSDVRIPRDVLGIRLSMTKAETDARLKEIGKFLRPDRRRQEVWEVRDPRFSHVIIGFEKDGELRFVTAVAREGSDAKRFSYQEAGPLETARQEGDPSIKNFYYQWELPAQGKEPQTLVIARGRDAEFLSTYSLKRIGDFEKSKEDEED